MRALKVAAAILAGALCLHGAPVAAQQSSAVVVSSCGTPPATYPAGANRAITQDTTGKLCTGTTGSVSLSPATTVVSTAVESCHVLKASPGTLYGLTVNTTASATANDWVMLFDATSAPADGAVTPKDWFRISATQTIGYSVPLGVTYSTGIVACLSTTGPLTKTAEAQAVFSGKIL